MTGDRSLRDYDLESGDEAVIDDPLVFLAQPDSIIVTKEFAERNGLSVGSKLTLSTMVGDKAFTVRGIMRSGGLTSAFGGNLAVMDIYAAQQVFGRGRRFDRIDLKLKEGTPIDAGQGGHSERRRDWLRRGVAVGTRPAARVHSGGVRDFDECLERLRAVHRHVHHLQLVFHRRHAAAVGNRHPSRAWRAAASDSQSVPGRKRGQRPGGICWPASALAS